MPPKEKDIEVICTRSWSLSTLEEVISMASRAQPRAEESCERQMGPKGAFLGQAELSLGALGTVGTGGLAPRQAGGGTGSSVVTCLGWFQGSGQVYLEQKQLAAPTAGQWEDWVYSDQICSLLLQGGRWFGSRKLGDVERVLASDWLAGALLSPKPS